MHDATGMTVFVPSSVKPETETVLETAAPWRLSVRFRCYLSASSLAICRVT